MVIAMKGHQESDSRRVAKTAAPGKMLLVGGRPAVAERRRDVHLVVRYLDGRREREVIDPYAEKILEVRSA